MDFKKLVALLEQLPDAVKREVAVGVAAARNDVSNLRGELPGMIDSALSAKLDPMKNDLDDKVRAALDKLSAEGVDLSKLEDAISRLGGGSADKDDDAKPGSDGSSLSRLAEEVRDLDKADDAEAKDQGGDPKSFKAFSQGVDGGAAPEDAKPSPAADERPQAPADAGESKGVTTEAMAAGGLTEAMHNDAANGGGQSPAEAGKTAAEQAKAAGLDDIAAAARAAYVRAVDLAMSPDDAFNEAQKAAREAGAGVPEAARAATNAAG